MKNVEAFKKYYANATKEQVIEDMYLDNCNLQQELQRKDNIINQIKKYIKDNKTNTYQTLNFENGETYNTALLDILDIVEEKQ